jgi:preprotein translocase subunit SecD
MTNLRAFLLLALALCITSNLPVCAAQGGATHTSKTQPYAKVRYSKVRLIFREQKLGTETQFQRERQVQQELLQKQAELKKAGTPAAKAANKAALKRSDTAIASLFGKPILTEKNVVDAYPDSSANSSMVSIGLKFDAEGSKIFAALTKKLAGTGRAVGIFLNDRLMSYPIVSAQYAQTGITGGSAVITGNFSVQEAKDLAAQLNPN